MTEAEEKELDLWKRTAADANVRAEKAEARLKLAVETLEQIVGCYKYTVRPKRLAVATLRLLENVK